MAKGQYKIPFNKDGNLIAAVYRWDQNQYTWLDNFKFTDTLQYTGYGLGRSSCYIYFKSASTGRKYHMSITDFDKLLGRKLFQNNEVTSEFTFTKRGTSYFLIPILENLPKP